MFDKLSRGDEVIVERKRGTVANGSSFVVRGKIDHVSKKHVLVGESRFDRTTGVGVGPHDGRLLPRTPETLSRLGREEAEAARRLLDQNAQFLSREASQQSDALAAAGWLLTQTPEAVVAALGRDALLELGLRFIGPNPTPEETP